MKLGAHRHVLMQPQSGIAVKLRGNTLDYCVLALKGLHILAQGIALGKKNEVLFEPR